VQKAPDFRGQRQTAEKIRSFTICGGRMSKSLIAPFQANETKRCPGPEPVLLDGKQKENLNVIYLS